MAGSKTFSTDRNFGDDFGETPRRTRKQSLEEKIHAGGDHGAGVFQRFPAQRDERCG